MGPGRELGFKLWVCNLSDLGVAGLLAYLGHAPYFSHSISLRS